MQMRLISNAHRNRFVSLSVYLFISRISSTKWYMAVLSAADISHRNRLWLGAMESTSHNIQLEFALRYVCVWWRIHVWIMNILQITHAYYCTECAKWEWTRAEQSRTENELWYKHQHQHQYHHQQQQQRYILKPRNSVLSFTELNHRWYFEIA